MGKTPLAAAVDLYIQGRRDRGEIAPVTADHFVTRLGSLVKSFGDRPLSELDRHAVEEWQARIGHLAVASRKSYLSTARTFTFWLTREGWLTVDPCEGLPKLREPRRVPRALSGSAVAELLKTIRTERDRAMILLMLQCGLRRGEVATLETADYDPLQRVLLVVGKSSNERMVPVTEEAALVLDTYLDRTGWQAGPMFRPQRHTRKNLSPRAITGIVSDRMRAAGLKLAPYDGKSSHALRHTAASDALEHSRDLRAVQQMLGHQSLHSTEIYLRRADLGRLRNAMEGRTYVARTDKGAARNVSQEGQ